MEHFETNHVEKTISLLSKLVINMESLGTAADRAKLVKHISQYEETYAKQLDDTCLEAKKFDWTGLTDFKTVTECDEYCRQFDNEKRRALFRMVNNNVFEHIEGLTSGLDITAADTLIARKKYVFCASIKRQSMETEKRCIIFSDSKTIQWSTSLVRIKDFAQLHRYSKNMIRDLLIDLCAITYPHMSRIICDYTLEELSNILIQKDGHSGSGSIYKNDGSKSRKRSEA